jgi:hypothetical protein
MGTTVRKSAATACSPLNSDAIDEFIVPPSNPRSYVSGGRHHSSIAIS